MSIFKIVKCNINLREAAQLYGVDVNRYGTARCPFHNDRHPGLYVADDYYHCFVCGEQGDVIDFTAKLFGISLKEAAEKLIIDFHINPDKPPTAAVLHANTINTDARTLKGNERLCVLVLPEYRDKLEERKKTNVLQKCFAGSRKEGTHERNKHRCYAIAV